MNYLRKHLIVLGKQKLMIRQAKKERARLLRVDRGTKNIEDVRGEFQDFADENFQQKQSFSRDKKEGRRPTVGEVEEELLDFQNIENEVKYQENDIVNKFNSTGNHENIGQFDSD